jgi:hypothetical protein
VDCEYKVTINYDLHFSGGFTMWQSGVMQEAIIKFDEDTELFKGGGQMAFVGGATGDPHCMVTLSFGTSSVTMRGHRSLNDGQITLDFVYGPLSQNFTNACPFGSGSGGVNALPPPAAVQSLTFPESGATKSKRLQMGGRLTVTLVPVEAEGKK